jgi:hypothetical protein
MDACNPLLQAHPTWARDEHEGRGIPTSLTPVSPSRSASRRPIWAGARGDIHSSAQGPPGLETPTKPLMHFLPWKIDYPSLIPFLKKNFMMLSLALANKNILFSNKSDASVGGNVFKNKNL